MDKKTANAILSAIQKVVGQTAVGNSMKLAGCKGRFTDTSLTLTMELHCMDGDVDADERKCWNTHCGRYGLRPDDLGKTFLTGGKKYQIVGINLKRPKFPFIVEDMYTNRRYNFDVTVIDLAGLTRNS